MSNVITRTDLVTNDKYFRLRCKIESRVELLERIYVKSRRSPLLTHLLGGVPFQGYVDYCRECISRLDEYIITSNSDQYYSSILRFVNSFPSMNDPFCKKFLQFSSMGSSPAADWLLDHLACTSRLTAFRVMEARLKLEIRNTVENNWFVLFSTLTVNSDKYKEVFEKGSDVWRNYLRSVQRAVAKECYGSWRAAIGEDYFEYFAVVESGGNTGRLHIHVLFFMKKLPRGCKDPNASLKVPGRREVKKLCDFWSYGFSSHVAVRFGNYDAFGRSGWTWPVDKRNKKGIPSSDVNKLAGYIVKYIQKSKVEKLDLKGDVRTWRTRLSRTMGKKILLPRVQSLKTEQLKAIMANRQVPVPIHLNKVRLPFRMVRSMAAKEYCSRIRSEGKLLESVLERNQHIRELLKCEIPKIYHRNQTNFGSLIQRVFGNMVVYDGMLSDFISGLHDLGLLQAAKADLRCATAGSPKVIRM